MPASWSMSLLAAKSPRMLPPNGAAEVTDIAAMTAPTATVHCNHSILH